YVAFDRALRLAAIPGFRSVAPPLARIVGAKFNDPRFIRVADATPWAKRDPNRAYAEIFCGSYFSSARAAEVFHHDFLHQTSGDDPVAFIARQMGTDGSPLARAMWFDLTSYLPDDLNVKMDRATMAYGLEARAPFLDQSVVAYALRLPLKEKVSHGKTKVALKRALHGIVPDAVLSRKKRGFQVPLADWFRGPLKDYWRDQCLDPNGSLVRYVHLSAIQRLFNENARGANHGNRLWMLLSLAVWLDRYELT
ncbi:MAG TPA: asparagine synthase C-terminal domain-containing protein, partial [Candidatus Methylomirabilis sp.]|nr:asparagine synthase C-terminal domain-containing protein [Candidatus Methylomirabilis sp.]